MVYAQDETSRSTVVFSDLSSVLNNQLNAALRQDLPVVIGNTVACIDVELWS